MIVTMIFVDMIRNNDDRDDDKNRPRIETRIVTMIGTDEDRDEDKMIKAVHYQITDPGTRWIKDAEIAVDSNGPLDAGRCLTPNVIKVEGGYRMYYHGFGPKRPNPESKGYILSAFSTDGENWKKEPGVRLDAGGEGAEHYIWAPDVIPLPDGGYRMYVEGRTEQASGGARSAIISALSDDGLVWEREPGIRLGSEHASYGAPRCLYLDPGRDGQSSRYRLYVSASPFPDRAPPPGGVNGRNIVSAVSGDGLHFELEPGVRVAQENELESYSVYAPEVLRLGEGGYRMYYAGWVAAPEVPAGSKYHGRIFSAISRDGLDWRKDPGICLDNGGRWDTAKASEPCVIDLPDGGFRMFYEACDLKGRWRIASATSAASPRSPGCSSGERSKAHPSRASGHSLTTPAS